MRTLLRAWAGGALAVVLGPGVGAAWAQPDQPDRPALNQPSGVLPPRFSKVEQMVGDVDPLGVSIRNLQTDLRLPTGFRDVFRIQGSAMDAARWGVPNPTGGDLFARIDGAITAVFPQSVYLNTRNGVLPLIPPGTVFFIGPLPFDRFGAGEEPAPSPDWVDSRVDTRVEPATPPPTSAVQQAPSAPTPAPRREQGTSSKRSQPKEPVQALPSIMTDELLRRKTVHDLIMKAADAAPKPPTNSRTPTAPPIDSQKQTAPVTPGRP